MTRLLSSFRPLFRASTIRTVKTSKQNVSFHRFFSAQTFLDVSEVQQRVLSVVSNFEKVDPKKLTKEANFKEDLSLDSLDIVEVVMAMEEEFTIEIPDTESEKLT